ncbi:hypothetical protein CDAR_26561 [Caerostris darwini]|uniref:Uncharacterized protein n=1 Tax=Caerostris darwini TaxID=1538125 RepID=A0AAV4QJU1_9ARAC|nr:hypothetical protein CDAR_26561 [Caerostris darwini]
MTNYHKLKSKNDSAKRFESSRNFCTAPFLRFRDVTTNVIIRDLPQLSKDRHGSPIAVADPIKRPTCSVVGSEAHNNTQCARRFDIGGPHTPTPLDFHLL